MKIFLLCLCSLAVNTPVFCQTNAFQGEYKISHRKPKHFFKLLQIHYKNGGEEVLFYFEANNGASAYNSGALYGRLTLNKTTGHLQYIAKDTVDDCSLDLAKTGNKIEVKTISGTCPFGYGVKADGVYKKVKKSNPAYFEDMHGQTIYFDRTSPEQYEF